MWNNLPDDISSITLCVTNNCNFSCRYCFVEQDNKVMSLALAEAAIKFLAKSTAETKTLNFFGGEPFLVWDELVKPSIEYAKNLIPDIKIGITTNGSLLSEKIIQFLGNNNIELLFSMDGDYITQSYNRPAKGNQDLFNKIKTNLSIATTTFPELVVRGTIIPETCDNLFNNLMFLREAQINRCYFIPNELTTTNLPVLFWTEDTFNILKDEIRKYTIYLINSIKSNQIPINLIPYTSYFLLDPEIKSFLDLETSTFSCSSCGLGLKNIIIDPVGNIFACQQMITKSNYNEMYLLGTVNTGIDLNKQATLISQVSKLKEQIFFNDNCTSCKLFTSCIQDFCHANKVLTANQSFNILCEWKKLLYKEATFTLFLLKLNDMENLQNILKILFMKDSKNGK